MRLLKSLINLILCTIALFIGFILFMVIASCFSGGNGPMFVAHVLRDFNIYEFLIPFLIIMLFLSPLFLIPIFLSVKRYFKHRKLIKMNFKNYYRDIPCDGDILEIYYYSYKTGLILNKYNIINTFIIKWYYENNIKIYSKNKILFVSCPEDEYEKKLYQILIKFSNNDVLKFKKLNKYMKKNYEVFEVWHMCFIENLTQTIYDNSDFELPYIIGFMKYLEHFSSSDSLEIEDIHMWEKYILVASIFGLTKNIQKKCESFSNIDLTLINPYYTTKDDYQLVKRIMNHMSSTIDSIGEDK